MNTTRLDSTGFIQLVSEVEEMASKKLQCLASFVSGSSQRNTRRFSFLRYSNAVLL